MTPDIGAANAHTLLLLDDMRAVIRDQHDNAESLKRARDEVERLRRAEDDLLTRMIAAHKELEVALLAEVLAGNDAGAEPEYDADDAETTMPEPADVLESVSGTPDLVERYDYLRTLDDARTPAQDAEYRQLVEMLGEEGGDE